MDMEESILSNSDNINNTDDIIINGYKPEYKEYFKIINYEWLFKYFRIEERDEIILSDPEGEVIKKGGFIFFAEYKQEVAGVCALLKYDDNYYEISKMAVLEKFHGKKIGKALLEAAIAKAKSLGAKSIFLETHINLTKAINLYRKYGFLPSRPIRENKYERKGFTMRLDLCKGHFDTLSQ